MKISNIGKYKWDRWEESYDTWYDLELAIETYYFDPLTTVYPLTTLSAVVANYTCYWERKGCDAWDKTIRETLNTRGYRFLQQVVRGSESYINKSKKVLTRVRKAKSIDIKLFSEIKEALTNLWCVFTMDDIGYYIPEVMDKILQRKKLTADQINEIKNYYLTIRKPLAYRKEEKNLLWITSLIKDKYNLDDLNADNLPSEILREIQNHRRRFTFMSCSDLDTEPGELEYFLNKLKELEKARKLSHPLKISEKTLRSLSKEDKLWLENINKHIYLDNYTQDIYQQIKFYFQSLVSNNFNVPFRNISFYTIAELAKLIAEGKKLSDKEIEVRRKYRVMVQINGEIDCFYGEKNYLRALSLLEDRKEVKTSIIKGTIACLGYARGVVKIVKGTNDIDKVEKGDILVSGTTRPDLMSAIRRCSAIVADSGGVTSHAAIVARELNIPCIVGCGIATKILKDGMQIEVDADQGIIKIIR